MAKIISAPLGLDFTEPNNRNTYYVREGNEVVFNVKLDSPISESSTIELFSQDTRIGSEIGISISSITFTPSNWDTPQPVTITRTESDMDITTSRYLIVGKVVSGTQVSSAIAYARDSDGELFLGLMVMNLKEVDSTPDSVSYLEDHGTSPGVLSNTEITETSNRNVLEVMQPQANYYVNGLYTNVGEVSDLNTPSSSIDPYSVRVASYNLETKLSGRGLNILDRHGSNSSSIYFLSGDINHDGERETLYKSDSISTNRIIDPPVSGEDEVNHTLFLIESGIDVREEAGVLPADKGSHKNKSISIKRHGIDLDHITTGTEEGYLKFNGEDVVTSGSTKFELVSIPDSGDRSASVSGYSKQILVNINRGSSNGTLHFPLPLEHEVGNVINFAKKGGQETMSFSAAPGLNITGSTGTDNRNVGHQIYVISESEIFITPDLRN